EQARVALELEADLLARLAQRSRDEVAVIRVRVSAGETDLARPAIALALGATHQEHVGSLLVRAEDERDRRPARGIGDPLVLGLRVQAPGELVDVHRGGRGASEEGETPAAPRASVPAQAGY